MECSTWPKTNLTQITFELHHGLHWHNAIKVWLLGLKIIVSDDNNNNNIIIIIISQLDHAIRYAAYLNL